MNAWIDQIFESAIAQRGGIVRRKISSIDAYASRAEVKRVCKANGYHIVRHNDQWLIFCDKGEVKIVL